MNSLSDNIYIQNRRNTLSDYSLHAFLFNEMAVEKSGTVNDVLLALYKILTAYGFKFQTSGARVLAALTARYIIKSDYSEQKALSEISDSSGAEIEYMLCCVRDAIKRNTTFVRDAQRSLCMPVPQNLSVSDTVSILGALFKIYYNYTVTSEEFPEDSIHAINFSRVELNNGNGKRRKKA